MRLKFPTLNPSAPQEFPDELYIGFVDNLLVEVRSLFLACTASVAAAVLAAVASGSRALWICAGLMLLLSCVRMHFQLIHARNRPSPNVATARMRENIFIAGATAHMALLSTWTLVAFAVTDEGFVRFLAATVTVPYTFGMWTRSFALDRGINAQIVVAFVPLSAALLVGGGWYPTLIFISLLPLFLFIKSSSTRLKGIFRAEVAARNRSAMLAERLDTALNNMSHGLCMIDRQGRLILANDKFHTIFRLPVERALDGVHARAVFRKLVRTRSIGERNSGPSVKRRLRQEEQRFGYRRADRDSGRQRDRNHRPQDEGQWHRSGHPGRHRAARRASAKSTEWRASTPSPGCPIAAVSRKSSLWPCVATTRRATGSP